MKTFYFTLVTVLIILFFGTYARADCPSGFKTQDFADFNTATPRFTISLEDRAADCDAKTGVVYNTTGLWISVRADVQSEPTLYSVADGTIEAINLVGTYNTPSADKIRFSPVPDMDGIYEIQSNRSFFNRPRVKTVDVCVGGVTDVPNPTCMKIYVKAVHCGAGGC